MNVTMQSLNYNENFRNNPALAVNFALVSVLAVLILTCNAMSWRIAENFAVSVISGLIPQAAANGTFDYSGQIPDGMLLESKPNATRPASASTTANSKNGGAPVSTDKTISFERTHAVETNQDTVTPVPKSISENQNTSDHAGLKIEPAESATANETSAPPTENIAPSENAWERIRSGYRFASLDNKIVRNYEKFYSKNPKTMERIVERARHYLPYIVSQVERRDLPLELALLPIVESAYNPRAYSRAGAAGLWQFMPYTGKQYGLIQNWWYEGRRDIVASTDAALRHLHDLSLVFDNDWHLVLAAYNAGMYGVQRAIRKNKKRNKPTDYSSLDLAKETRHFVPKLIAIRNIVTDPTAFGLTLPYLPMKPLFEVVYFDFQVDLGIIAAETQIQGYRLAQLNPGLRRTVTPPNGPHRVLVPSDTYHDVMSWKSNLQPSHAVTTVFYRVRKGDMLGTIAQNHNVSVSAIKSVNSMNTDLIRIGQMLRIPTPASLAKGEFRLGSNSHIIYRVRKGDALGKIAQRYDVSIAALKSANVLHSDLIIVGQKLRIPTPGSRTVHDKTVAAAPSEDKLDQNKQFVIHNVVEGDNLYRIALKYGVSVAQLRISNTLSSDRIIVGQKIRVPMTGYRSSANFSPAEPGSLTSATRYVYIVKPGDTLWNIARIHQTTVSNLMKWNGIDKTYRIHTDQQIVIYVY